MPVGVVYSLNQNLCRRVIRSSGGLDLHRQQILHGEGWLDLTDEEYNACDPEFYSLDALISEKLGYLNPQDDNCIVVDGNNTVVSIVKADPIIDEHPDGFIIRDSGYKTGDTYEFLP